MGQPSSGIRLFVFTQWLEYNPAPPWNPSDLRNMPARAELISHFPILAPPCCVRPLELADTHRFAAWPNYPFPYEPFDMSYKRVSPEEREPAFRKREQDSSRFTFAIDGEIACAGYLCLFEIDWQKATVGNMSYRIHPDWCGKGIGSAALKAVTELCLDCGFESLSLDVAASNTRAVRCYEKCGFRTTGEFFRDANLDGVDIGEPKYDFLRPHLASIDGHHDLRFYWMQRTRALE